MTATLKGERFDVVFPHSGVSLRHSAKARHQAPRKDSPFPCWWAGRRDNRRGSADGDPSGTWTMRVPDDSVRKDPQWPIISTRPDEPRLMPSIHRSSSPSVNVPEDKPLVNVAVMHHLVHQAGRPRLPDDEAR